MSSLRLKGNRTIRKLLFIGAATLMLGWGYASVGLGGNSAWVWEGHASAAAQSVVNSAEAFRTATEALYQAVQQGEPLEVTRRLRETEAAFKQMPVASLGSVEGAQALATQLALMKRAVASVSPNGDVIKKNAAALRLAADALARPEQPLWLQYRKLMQENLADIAAGLTANPSKPEPKAKPAFQQLSERYALIRTAVALQREPSVLERGDAIFRYADRLLSAKQPDPKLVAGLIEPLSDAVNGLFPAETDSRTTAAPLFVAPAWGFFATIGTFIVSVLTYSGWRRYRYDQEHGIDASDDPHDGPKSR